MTNLTGLSTEEVARLHHETLEELNRRRLAELPDELRAETVDAHAARFGLSLDADHVEGEEWEQPYG